MSAEKSWTFAKAHPEPGDPKKTATTSGETWFVARQKAAVELKAEPSELVTLKDER